MKERNEYEIYHSENRKTKYLGKTDASSKFNAMMFAIMRYPEYSSKGFMLFDTSESDPAHYT